MANCFFLHSLSDLFSCKMLPLQGKQVASLELLKTSSVCLPWCVATWVKQHSKTNKCKSSNHWHYFVLRVPILHVGRWLQMTRKIRNKLQRNNSGEQYCIILLLYKKEKKWMLHKRWSQARNVDKDKLLSTVTYCFSWEEFSSSYKSNFPVD